MKKQKRQRRDEQLSQSILEIRKRMRIGIITMVSTVALVLVLVFSMAAAWYTNVAKTSDLTFQTEVWGFDEKKITLPEESEVILAGPGMSGVIPLTVDNSESTEGVRISMTISKLAMEEEELRKRIFFYTESSGEIAGETMTRTYLGASEADHYTYTIHPGQKLILSEEYYNDVPIRWEWVYDMTGYYFRGRVNDKLKAGETGAVVADEYLRPITYDYSRAVFDVKETVTNEETGETIDNENYGQLSMIGEKTLAEFLLEVSKSDGYEGTIDAVAPVILQAEGETVLEPQRLYYPVDVDKDGYGIWAYLCTRNEIKEAVIYDTALQEEEEAVQAKVNIVLTATSISQEAYTVDSALELKKALTDPNVASVELNTDVELGENIILAGDMDKVVNLNGYTLTCSPTLAAGEKSTQGITVEDGASLTMMNGSLYSGSQTAVSASELGDVAFGTSGGELVLSNLTISGFDTILEMRDMDALDEEKTMTDSIIKITNCTMDASQIGIRLQGNGTDSENLSKVIIQDSTLTAGYMGISGQGNDDRYGTELVVLNSVVEGYYTALYHPQRASKAFISGSTLSGITGVVVKGGVVTIEDTKVTGTGPYTAAAAANSGFVDTGDGVYVEAVYGWTATVILKGKNEIISENAYAVDLFGQKDKGPGKMMIYGGSHTGAKGSALWNGIGIFEIYGGTYAGNLNSPEETPIVRYDLETEE